jgi:hypothetical protein
VLHATHCDAAGPLQPATTAEHSAWHGKHTRSAVAYDPAGHADAHTRVLPRATENAVVAQEKQSESSGPAHPLLALHAAAHAAQNTPLRMYVCSGHCATHSPPAVRSW